MSNNMNFKCSVVLFLKAILPARQLFKKSEGMLESRHVQLFKNCNRHKQQYLSVKFSQSH